MNSRVSSAAQCNCAPSCGTRFAASCSIVQQHCRDRRYRPGLRSQSQWHVHMTRDEVVPSWLRGGGCQDDLGVVGSAVVNSRGLAHTETTVRDPYDPAPLDVSRCEWVVGGLHGRPFAEYASGYPLDAGVLAADRIDPNPPHTRSAVLIPRPIRAGSRLSPPTIRLPVLGRNTLSSNPDKPDPIKSASQS